MGGFIILLGYEWSASRYAGVTLPPRTLALGGFTAFAIGNAIGLSLLSGGSVRYRLYARHGLGASEVAHMTLFASLSLGCALPPLAALGRVPPLRVLRRDLLPIPSSTWMVYGAALLALGLIMWRLSLDLVLTFALLGGGVVAALILGGLLLLLLQSLRRLLARASLPWRLGLGRRWVCGVHAGGSCSWGVSATSQPGIA